ncbi:hypothetical protein AB0A71_24495 [Kitasatospora aureofaciens]|uniref:hypothetical protein n=1 Tax=Kitasatospora aureofaciens TaxID=1894 RepID=UPI0033C8B7F7
MTTPRPRRSRRLSRAKALGAPLGTLDTQRPPAVPAPPRLPAPTAQRPAPATPAAQRPAPQAPVPGIPAPARVREEPCCRVRTERFVSLGGTVFVIHRHQPACPRWTIPATT